MDRVQLADPPCRAALAPPQRPTTVTAITILSTPSSSTTSSVATVVVQEVLDCAICLDNIRPKHHAKAILACRHEFHLSCISMAFSLGKEMICPLCRFLHKEQPFMYSEDEATKPLATTSTQASESQTAAVSPSTSSTATVSSGRNRNRNNSIHLQHNLSNLVQHQQRRRGSTYDLRRGSVSSLPSPTTPTTTGLMTLSGAPQSREERTGLWSLMPFLGSLGSSSNNSTLSHTSHRRLSSSMAPSRYLSTSVWFMLYGLPFSVAILFLAFILGQVETLWSKISCLIGSVICYMVCWAMVVAFLVPTHHAIHLPFSDELSAMGSATAASSMAMVGAATIATAVGATTAAAMEYEFDVVDAFTENVGQSHVLGGSTRPRQQQLLQRQQQQQQQESQGQQQQHADDILVSSVSMFSWMTPGICSLSRWLLSSPYAQDLQSRMTDLVEILDDYSESFGGW